MRVSTPVYGLLACTAYTLLAGELLLSPWLPGAISALASPVSSSSTLVAVIVLGVFPAALGTGLRDLGNWIRPSRRGTCIDFFGPGARDRHWVIDNDDR